MSDTRNDLPPGPYTFETITAKGRPEGTGHIYLLDANGRKIASMWGSPKEKVALANLICDAKDKLRTPGTVEVCERWRSNDCSDYPQSDFDASLCHRHGCPRKAHHRG